MHKNLPITEIITFSSIAFSDFKNENVLRTFFRIQLTGVRSEDERQEATPNRQTENWEQQKLECSSSTTANKKKGESVEGENGSCKKKMWKKASLKANKRDIRDGNMWCKYVSHASAKNGLHFGMPIFTKFT